jgi:SAM-dependent methyltransferase
MKEVQQFFDTHAHHHAYHREIDFYVTLAQVLRNIGYGRKLSILDMGCGDGAFITEMINLQLIADFVGIDISKSMIEISNARLKSPNVHLLVSDGFKIPFRKNLKFDVIHIDSVLHHLIGKTVSQSTSMAFKMLRLLSSMLYDKGIIIVEEFYYNSYLRPHLTSSTIFYALKFLNALHFDMSKISDEIVLGLEVNFFDEDQIGRLLQQFGKVDVIKRRPMEVSSHKRIFLLKEFGHITFLIHKSS